jgi:hypothetical protein
MSLNTDGNSSEAEFEERRKMNLWERFDALEQECRRGHRELRKATNELEAQADSMEKDIATLSSRVNDVASAPVEATKLRFSPQVLAVIFTATISLVGGAYAVGNRVTSRIDTFEARIDRQADADKIERVNTAKLLEERYLRSEKQFEAFGRQMELMKYEQQRLREDVTKKNGSTR